VIKLNFTLNGVPICVEVDPRERLIDLLRNRLGLTGTKEGCGEGECGACTILVNAKPVNSCLMLAVQVQGQEVLTIEGIGSRQKPHPVQRAFVEVGAVQCGYCTPGMILAAVALLQANPRPNRKEIRQAMSGNLCRCTGYENIILAVEQAAREVSG
jgi:aerobic-type carbon monoxide dehydrogenase small subunit (CoxS/CutS family)